MKFLNFSNIVTDWKQLIEKESQKPYFINMDNLLFNESKSKKIFPPQNKIFQCFNFFNINQTKVVIFGQDPYFNEHQANGLSFSVNNTIPLPPSLQNIFKELNNDLKINRTNGDLSDWASQGVLLINSSLTVIAKKPNSHKNIGWKEFLISVINELNHISTHKIIFVCLGNNAKKLKQYINLNFHILIETSHPSPLSVNKGFKDSKIFSKINKLLTDKINW